MKLDKIVKASLVAVILSSVNGIAYGVESNLVVPGVTTSADQVPTSPQIEAATRRVDTAKTNLDLAHKRLDAAKSLLKAAEAEYKAAKTDKSALLLSTQAQQLADASGLPKNGENVPAPTGAAATTNALPATPAAAPVYNSENTIDYSGGSAPAPSAQ